MSKSLDTLVSDIYKVLEEGVNLSSEAVDDMSQRLSRVLSHAFGRDGQNSNTLRMSSIGQPCRRKLWYQVNKPELEEPLKGNTLLKFAIGHIIEEVVLTLAKAAGHDVKGEQDELHVAGVKGHRDAVIDGVLVDVKSANSRSFKKFKFNEVPENDGFGYMTQLGLYHHASKDELDDKKSAAFLAVDKELGHLVVDKYDVSGPDYEALVEERKRIVAGPRPARDFQDQPDGKSGNRVIPMECKYCPFKEDCWADVREGRGLEKIIMGNGPKWFTRVERVPQPRKAVKF